MSGLIIRVMALKCRAMYQYGVGGGGGGLSIKKVFDNSPCKMSMSGVRNNFFIRKNSFDLGILYNVLHPYVFSPKYSIIYVKI